MYLVPLNYALTVKMKNITLCVFYHDRFLKKRSHLFHPEKILTPHNVETVALGLWIAAKWVMKACTLSHARLFATSWTIAYLPGFSVHGILQARILGWVAISFSGTFPTFPQIFAECFKTLSLFLSVCRGLCKASWKSQMMAETWPSPSGRGFTEETIAS